MSAESKGVKQVMLSNFVNGYSEKTSYTPHLVSLLKERVQKERQRVSSAGQKAQHDNRKNQNLVYGLSLHLSLT